MNFTGKVEIRESTKDDLANILELWNNGEVMFFVGYPNGLGTTLSNLEKWLTWVINKPHRCHYSVYSEGIGYCGESFYDLDERGTAALDIKLLPKAQGKGIAGKALKYAINKAFSEGNAERVYVDPSYANQKAWILYKKLGFIPKPRPDCLEDGETYLEMTKDEWDKNSNKE